MTNQKDASDFIEKMTFNFFDKVFKLNTAMAQKDDIIEKCVRCMHNPVAKEGYCGYCYNIVSNGTDNEIYNVFPTKDAGDVIEEDVDTMLLDKVENQEYKWGEKRV